MLASRSSNAQMLKFARCGQAGVKVQGPAFAGLRHKVEADGDSHGEAPQAHLSQHRDPHRHHRQEAHHHASHQQHEQHGQRGKEQPQQLLQMHQQTLHEHFVFQGQDGQGSSRQHPSLAQFPQQRVPQPHHHHQQQHMHIGSQGGGRYGSAYGSAPMPASAPMAYSQGTPAFAGVSYGQGQASPAFGLLLPVSLLAYSSFPCLRPPPPPSLPARRCRGSGLSCEVWCVWLSWFRWAGLVCLACAVLGNTAGGRCRRSPVHVYVRRIRHGGLWGAITDAAEHRRGAGGPTLVSLALQGGHCCFTDVQEGWQHGGARAGGGQLVVLDGAGFRA